MVFSFWRFVSSNGDEPGASIHEAEMLDFAIFAVTLLAALLCAVFYLYPASRKSSGFPGLSPTDEKDGNLADIVAAGSLHAFLERLHRTHGPASSFWFGRRLVVSLASLPLLREHINPNCTCDPFEAMLKSLLGFEAKGTHVGDHLRRKLYEKAVNKALHASMEMLIELSHELQKQWQSLPIDEHIPLHQHMMGFALRAITCATLGQSFAGGSQLLALRRNHDALWSEIGKGFLDGSLERDLNRRKHFDNALQEMRVGVERVVVGTKCGVSEVSSPTAFLDILLQGSDSSEQVVEDAMTFCLAGCNMTANLCTWTLYFLAANVEEQEVLRQELQEVVGESYPTLEKLNKLERCKCILQEAARATMLVPVTAQLQEQDGIVSGQTVSKDTLVVYALGVITKDEAIWSEPCRFDPGRFVDNPEAQNNLALIGLAGSQLCPELRFAFHAATVLLCSLCLKFKFRLADTQPVELQPQLVTTPMEEVWLCVSEHKV